MKKVSFVLLVSFCSSKEREGSGYSLATPEPDELYYHEDYPRRGLERVPGTITYEEPPAGGELTFVAYICGEGEGLEGSRLFIVYTRT